MTLLSEDHLSYSFRDLLRKYIFGNPDSAVREDYRYRYSAGGQREQRRVYHSPAGETSGGIYSWTYYLLGAGDEQLAVYHGQQTSDAICDDNGRRVYIYPAEYHTLGVGGGTNIITRPTGEKQYLITDHLGSIRSVYSSYGASWGQYDYDPFGRLLLGTTPRNSYIDHERDSESGLLDLGVRKYDPLSGRFLSIDPLALLFPGESPYGYASASPIIGKDPSGFATVQTIGPVWVNGDPLEWGHYTEGVIGVRFAAGFHQWGVQGPVMNGNTGGGTRKAPLQPSTAEIRVPQRNFWGTLEAVLPAFGPGAEMLYSVIDRTHVLVSRQISGTPTYLNGTIANGKEVREAGVSLLMEGMLVYAGAALARGAAAAKGVLKPLGLGSTGRTAAANLTEQLAMKKIMANPTLGKTVMTGMKDSRWLGWNKMQYTHTALNGTKTTIHYVGKFENGVLKAVDDFKFVNP